MRKFLCKALSILAVSCGAFLVRFNCFAENFTLCDGFSYQDIPCEVQEIMKGKSYKENEYVKFEDLRLCKVRHLGFDGKEHEGELVVAYEVKSPITGKTVNVAKEALEIFKDMYDSKYPIEKMELIDYYDADDEKSMRNHNTCAFNFRYINGTKKISWHSYGLAIDINPFVNPCFHPDSKLVEPAGTEEYLNRDLNQVGLIKEGDACHKAFASRGWEWGGSWNNPKDYMHFQKFSWRCQRPEPKYLI